MAAFKNYQNLLNPWQNCLPSINGAFYNSTGANGQYTNTTTSTTTYYGCVYPFIFNGASKMTEAFISLFAVALTAVYLSS